MFVREKSRNGNLREQGFLVLDDFLTKEQHEELLKIYNDIKVDGIDGQMYSNVHHLSQDENLNIENGIIDICKTSIDAVLSDFQIMGASFMVKGTGNSSDSKLHQDWRIVDESKYNSYILWIPLIDVDETNGCLQVLPESHTWFNTVRSSNIESLFLDFNYKINSFIKPVPLRKTQAAVFISKLFHGSKINTSPFDRPAISITLIDKEAKYIHHFKDENNQVLILESSNRYEFKNSFSFDRNDKNDSISVVDSLGDISSVVLEEAAFFRKLYENAVLPYRLYGSWLYLKDIFSGKN